MLRRLLLAVAALALGGQAALACTGPGTTRVDQIYPSGPVVPDNILRLYLYFTGPMAEDDILSSVRLAGADGAPIDGAFLSNLFDLWSPDRTRLTVLFDPGRVKTGLVAHEALGRALSEGERYTLSVTTDALDADGCALEQPFTHNFVAGPTDLDPPDPGAWDVDLPSLGTREPLAISLGSAHDHLSMAFRIRVRRGDDSVAGRLALSDAETVWLFTPRDPWSADRYAIAIEPEFEDLAGNRPGRLFDQLMGQEMPAPELQLWFSPVVE
ncbi:MAG: hypothetical protein KI785_06035 [Devosiaceae bacterium]|nr:hypothetical protein [Devosiaceae bacterium MH13]